MVILELEDTVVYNVDDLTRQRTADAEPVTRVIPMMPRRPDATGENPIYRPATIGVVDEPLTTDQLPPLAAWAPAVPSMSERRKHQGRHRRTGFWAWIGIRAGGAR